MKSWLLILSLMLGVVVSETGCDTITTTPTVAECGCENCLCGECCLCPTGDCGCDCCNQELSCPGGVCPIPSQGYEQSGYEQSGIECPDDRLAADVPKHVREWFRNLTNPGSCVQCSIAICGVDQNVPAASTLLWDTKYGQAQLGGSYPSRVADYARERGLKIWNITGRPTYDWMAWAARNHRGCAIACESAHFQTLMGHDPETNQWYVCDNRWPDKIAVYDQRQFERLHEATGAWTVILDAPPAPARPQVTSWWE